MTEVDQELTYHRIENTHTHTHTHARTHARTHDARTHTRKQKKKKKWSSNLTTLKEIGQIFTDNTLDCLFCFTHLHMVALFVCNIYTTSEIDQELAEKQIKSNFLLNVFDSADDSVTFHQYHPTS